jgi:RNA polymerase sigma-70 factor (ECF subfamily)
MSNDRAWPAQDFEEFYRCTYTSLLRALAVVCTNRVDAEDALQDAYAAAARDWNRVRTLDIPSAWVRRVAINRAIDVARKSARRRDAHQRLEPPRQVLDELALEVQDALRQLPMDERVVIVLHHLLGLTVNEIAAEISRPTGTVKAQLVRARRRLGENLGLPLERS